MKTAYNFKFNIGQKIKHQNGAVGLITDLRIQQHKKPSYWIEYPNSSIDQKEGEINNVHGNETQVIFDFNIDDIVEDSVMGIRGRVICLNYNANMDKAYCIQSNGGDNWMKAIHLKIVN